MNISQSLRQPHQNALLITTLQNDSSLSLSSLEGGEGVNNKLRLEKLRRRFVMKTCKI